MIYTFSPFGYEGSIVTVETDLRRGIPAVDIVGLSDGAVKESRERIRTAVRNSGFDFPMERVLMSLSPCDVKKDGAGFDLPMALSLLASKDDYPRSQDAKVMVMGELELSGHVRPVRAVYPALVSAVENGIRYAIVPKGVETAVPDGIHASYVETLRDAYDELARIDEYESNGDGEFDEEFFGSPEDEEFKVEFAELEKDEPTLDDIKGMEGLKYAMAVAVAGGHHMLAYGKPDCGKTLTLQHLPELMPLLTSEESQSVTRIRSIAGLMSPNERMKKARPFRMPHQTASIEGICGGGVNCRPGEISLAHNGVLFLDEAAEFRTSVLQMLRIPLESNSITLSRAGRTTVYPAKFQLVMATNPCPCGNLGIEDKICLCSARSVEMYWRKFSGPLLDRIAIRYNCDKENPEDKSYTLNELREMIKVAYERQYKRQGKLNQYLNPQEGAQFVRLTSDAREELDKATEKYNFSSRAVANVMKLARTLADIHDDKEYETIDPMYVRIALQIRGHLPDIVEGLGF